MCIFLTHGQKSGKLLLRGNVWAGRSRERAIDVALILRSVSFRSYTASLGADLPCVVVCILEMWRV
jgi:hypothetical protein